MAKPPSPNGSSPGLSLAGSSVRDARGRFLPGNPGGPGNPNPRRTARYMEAMREAVTPEDIGAIARQLRDMAIGGDLAAAKLVLLPAVLKRAIPAVRSAPLARC